MVMDDDFERHTELKLLIETKLLEENTALRNRERDWRSRYMDLCEKVAAFEQKLPAKSKYRHFFK